MIELDTAVFIASNSSGAVSEKLIEQPLNTITCHSGCGRSSILSFGRYLWKYPSIQCDFGSNVDSTPHSALKHSNQGSVVRGTGVTKIDDSGLSLHSFTTAVGRKSHVGLIHRRLYCVQLSQRNSCPLRKAST